MRIDAPIPEENLFWGGAHTNGRMEVQIPCLSAKVLQEALKVQELHPNFLLALIYEFYPIFGDFWQFSAIKTLLFPEALKVENLPTKKMSL